MSAPRPENGRSRLAEGSRRSPLRPPATLGLGLVLALAVGACSAGDGAGNRSSAPSGGGALRVVATTSVLADMTRHVGGARVTVSSIIPPGVGPEDYEPRPEDARALATADLIVSNGMGLDDFLARLIEAGTDRAAHQVVLGEGIPAISTDGRPNPHFWLDPTLVARYYVTKLETGLAEADPAGAATYRSNGAAFAAELGPLDAELQAEVARIPAGQRKLVTDHDAFPYFARHFGFELVGVVLPNVGQEPTAADMAALVTEVRAAGVRAIFSEAQFSPRLVQALAAEAGVSLVSTLYSDALGSAPADSYEGLLRWDVGQIVAGLTGGAGG